MASRPVGESAVLGRLLAREDLDVPARAADRAERRLVVGGGTAGVFLRIGNARLIGAGGARVVRAGPRRDVLGVLEVDEGEAVAPLFPPRRDVERDEGQPDV